MENIILASTSPRRRELMKKYQIEFICAKPEGVEENIVSNMEISPQLENLSFLKARSVQKKYPTNTIVGADTIVYFDGEILGKPSDHEEAVKYLKRLSGNQHYVYTGVTLIRGSRRTSFTEITEVKFRDIPDYAIESYVNSGKPMDKAGSYGIQDYGALFVENINGDFYNVMGLPLGRLWVEFRNFGFEI